CLPLAQQRVELERPVLQGLLRLLEERPARHHRSQDARRTRAPRHRHRPAPFRVPRPPDPTPLRRPGRARERSPRGRGGGRRARPGTWRAGTNPATGTDTSPCHGDDASSCLRSGQAGVRARDTNARGDSARPVHRVVYRSQYRSSVRAIANAMDGPGRGRTLGGRGSIPYSLSRDLFAPYAAGRWTWSWDGLISVPM